MESKKRKARRILGYRTPKKKTLPRFEITELENGKAYYILKAKNGQVVLKSREFSSYQNCELGIYTIKELIPISKLQ